MGSVSFNIHRVAEQIGRPVLLSVMTINAIKKLHLHEAFDKIDYSRMSSFLSKIFQGYRRDVEYHNDLHAADVMQMCFLMQLFSVNRIMLEVLARKLFRYFFYCKK